MFGMLFRLVVFVILLIVVVAGMAMVCSFIGGRGSSDPGAPPQPVSARDLYANLANLGTTQPAMLQRLVKEKPEVVVFGQVTHTEIGKVQFHLTEPSALGHDTYVNCDMSDDTAADSVIVGQPITLHGRLKDAFNVGGPFGTIMFLENENIIELKDCVIVGG